MRSDQRRATLRRNTEDLLRNLGSSAESVAGSLRRAGAWGQPRSRTECAVARYLQAVMAADPEVSRIQVDQESVKVEGRRLWSLVTAVPLPAAVSDFITGFDKGGYPDLTQPPVRRPGGARRSPRPGEDRQASAP